jgi:hypothetical protein
MSREKWETREVFPEGNREERKIAGFFLDRGNPMRVF